MAQQHDSWPAWLPKLSAALDQVAGAGKRSVQYMREADSGKRRQMYCHCPRVREVLKALEMISPAYCYCGSGYCRSIWKRIPQRPVAVGVLETLLAGGGVCKVAVRLPSEKGDAGQVAKSA